MSKEPEFKRPDHVDFMDFWELKKAEWSGVRENKIGNQVEFWINGSIRETVSFEQLSLKPEAFQEAYERVFAMDEGQAQIGDKK